VKTVTYQGPSGYFVARHGAEKIKLPAGSAVEVPDVVAESLPEVAGHDFEIEGSTLVDEPDFRSEDAEPSPQSGDDGEDKTDPAGSTN
jgi:hypothetical protein